MRLSGEQSGMGAMVARLLCPAANPLLIRVLLSVIVSLMSVPRRVVCVEAGIMDLRVGPVSLPEDKAPLSVALAELGKNVRDGYVLFGVEVCTKARAEPKVKLHFEEQTTLHVALAAIVSQLPGYKSEVVSEHLINLYPTAWRGDPRNVLNIRAAKFDVVHELAGTVITWPQRFIPELRDRLSPKAEGKQRIFIFMGLVGVGPRVTLHLRDITVRQVLNAVSRATEQPSGSEAPFGWVYQFEPKAGLPTGGEHAWKALHSMPRDWKAQAKKAGMETPP